MRGQLDLRAGLYPIHAPFGFSLASSLPSGPVYVLFQPPTDSACLVPSMSTNKGEGRREDALVKERLKMRTEYERQKQTLISETEKARPSTHRFVGQHDSVEEGLKTSTVGLMHLEDFQQRKREFEEMQKRKAAQSDEVK